MEEPYGAAIERSLAVSAWKNEGPHGGSGAGATPPNAPPPAGGGAKRGTNTHKARGPLESAVTHPMKFPVVLAAVSLASLALVATPVAAADHCGYMTWANELKCVAYEVAGDALTPVSCLYNTAPADWGRECTGT